jgi:ABC-2 type transport system permease protein
VSRLFGSARGAFARQWRDLLADQGSLIVLAGAVLAYSLLYPLPYLPEILREVPVAVVDLDRSALSRRLERAADAHELVRVAARPDSVAEAESLVASGAVAGVLVVPEGFERDVLRGEPTTVGTWADAGYFLAYRQVLTGLAESVGTLSAGIEVRRAMGQGVPRGAALAAREPLPLLTRPLFNPAEGYATYVVPPVLVLVLQQTLLVGIGMLAGAEHEDAREGRPVARAGSAGAAGPVLGRVAGRCAALLAPYAAHCVWCFAGIPRLYHLPRQGGALALVGLALPFLLSVTLLGLALAPLFPRRETAIQALLVTSLPALFVSRFAWPSEALPAWLRAASLLLPTTSAIPAFVRVQLMGAGLGDTLREQAVLWGLCALYLPLAWRAERGRAV